MSLEHTHPGPDSDQTTLINRTPPSIDVLPVFEAGLRDSAIRDIFVISMDGLKTVVFQHPDHVRAILTAGTATEKGPSYRGVQEAIGRGILVTEGEEWRNSRRAMNDAFHQEHVNSLMGTVGNVAQTYVDTLRTRAAEGLTIDVQKEMTMLAFDTLVAALFGEHAETARQRLPYDELRNVFETANQIMGERTEETEAQIAHIKTLLGEVAHDMIADVRLKEPDDSLLSMLAYSNLSDETIRDEIATLMFAGHETTALTLTWLTRALKDHPAVLKRMQSEAKTALDGAPLDADTLPKLPYTRQVINEVLRLWSPTPMVARSVVRKTTIGSVALNPGDVVLPFIRGVHRHPDFWPSPETFDPERFSAENSKGRDKWSYLPFGGGQRKCIGEGFTLAEMPLIIAAVVNGVDMVVANDEIDPTMSMTLQPSAPIYARVTPRAA